MTESELISLFFGNQKNRFHFFLGMQLRQQRYILHWVCGRTKLRARSVTLMILIFFTICGYILHVNATCIGFGADVMEGLNRLKTNGMQLSPLSETLIRTREAGPSPLQLVLVLLVLSFRIGGIGYLIQQCRTASE